MIKVIVGVAAAAVLAVVAVAAGWYIFVREDAQLATSAPDIPDEVAAVATETPAATTAAEVTETTEPLAFQINSDLSEAAYFVDEELASIGVPSTAKGATNDVTGTIYLSASGTELDATQTSAFTVDLTGLTSDEDRRDQRVQQALNTSTYPMATFTITSVTGYDPAIPEGEEQQLRLTGVLELAGAQQEVTWDVLAYREGNAISALATLTISFADFEITPPTFQGLVSISDQATLQVQLIAELV